MTMREALTLPNAVLTDTTKMPKPLVWTVAAICVLPFLLNLVGVDFSTQPHPFDPSLAAGMRAHDMLEKWAQSPVDATSPTVTAVP